MTLQEAADRSIVRELLVVLVHLCNGEGLSYSLGHHIRIASGPHSQVIHVDTATKMVVDPARAAVPRPHQDR